MSILFKYKKISIFLLSFIALFFCFFLLIQQYKKPVQTNNDNIELVSKLDSIIKTDANQVDLLLNNLLSKSDALTSKEDLTYLYVYKIQQLLINNKIDSIPFYINKVVGYSNDFANNDLTTKVNTSLAKYYSLINDSPTSLKHALKALTTVDNLEVEIDLNNIIGIIYFELNDFEKSIEYFENSHLIALKLNDEKRLAVAKGNIGGVYLLKSDFNEASIFLQKSRQYFEKNKDTVNLVKINTTISKLALKEKNLKDAKYFLDEAERLSKKMDNDVLKALVDQHYGNFYLDTKEFVKAEKVYKEAYILSKQNNIQRSQLSALSGLRDVNSALNNFKKSAEIQNLYYQLRDSIYGVSTRKKIDEVVWLDKLEEKHSENKNLQHQFQLEKQKKTILIVLYSTIIISILIFMWFLYSNYKKNLHISKLSNDQLKSKVVLEQKLKENQENLYKQEIEKKNQELIALNLLILSKNKIFNEIESIVENNNEEKIVYELKNKVKSNRIQEKDWNKFRDIFEKMHPSFYITIAENFPQLSKTEIRICSYIKIELPKSEICTIMNITHNSLITSRYRIRKKLNLNSDDDLDEIIKSW